MSVENIKKKSVQDTSTSHFYSRIIFTPKKLGYMLPTPYKVKAPAKRSSLSSNRKDHFLRFNDNKKKRKKNEFKKNIRARGSSSNLCVLSILTKAGARHRI